MNRLLKLLLAIFFLLPGNAIYAQSDGGFTATPTEGCAPLSVQFTSNVGTNSAYTHNWTFGNSNGSGFANPTATYTTPGTYTVTHTVNGPNGQGTATKTITVHPSPVADFTATPTSVCPGTQVTFTFSGSLGVPGSANYSWVFGNGASPGTGSGSPVTTTYTDPGTNNVTLTVKNSKGCVASITKPAFITVKEKPVVNFTASPKTDYCANETATVTFTPTVTGGAPGPYTYSWDLDGAASTQTSPTHTYNGPAPAQYTIKLTVKSNNGCSETITRTNYIKLHNPKASFTSPVMACMYTMVNFTNISTTPGASFTWDFGDGSGTVSSQHGAHMYHSPGMYTVKLITSVGGCTDTAIGSIIIRPQPAPAILMTPAQPCPAPQTICFSTSKPMFSYDWAIENENGINLFTTANPCLTFGKNGFWPVVLRVTDSFGCKDTVIDVVKIYPLKIVSTVNYLRSDSGCVNFLARFTVGIYRDSNYVYPYGIKSVKWKFGDGDSSTAISPAHVYTDSGHFWPTVEVETNNGCIIRDTLRVATGYKPIVDSFEAIPTSVCPKTIVYFTGHVRGFKPLIYHWGFGDGGGFAINDSLMSHNYSCLDSYTVVLQASHNGCYSDTVQREKYIEVLPPCANFIRKQGDCQAPLTGYFEDKSKMANRVLWKFGDGDTSTQRNPTHTYPAPGIYTVWLIAYNDSVGCVDSMPESMYFGPNEPDFIADKRQLCVGDSVIFWAYLNGDTSQALFDWWIDGIRYKQNQDTYVHTFNTPGVYTVTVTSKDIDRGCPDTITKTDWITVGGPTAAFAAIPTHVCNPDTIHFNDTSFAGEGTTLVSRRWFFGTYLSDTLRTTGTSVSKYYDTTGDFDIGLIVKDNLGCADTLYNIQHVHVLKPVAAFSVPSPVCVGGDALFTNASANAQKSYWTFGDGGTDTTHPDVTHIYNAIGVFNTQLVVTDSLGCKDTSDIIPVTATKPIADFTVSDSISVCAPLIVNFDGRPSIRERNYEWHFDDGSSPGFKNTQTVAYNNPKEYKVKLIVKDSLGCRDSITKPVRVLGYAGAFTYSPVEGCVPLTVNFTSMVLGKIPTIIWDFGDGNSFLGDYQQPNVTYTYTKPGKFLPRLIFNNGLGCQIGSEGVDTILADDAIADFETGPACEYSVVEFINKSYGVVKPLTITHWEFHDGSFSALVNPKRKYGAPGKYRVQLYVKNQNGCEDTLEKDITIHTPIEVNAGGDTIICLTDSAQLKPSGGVSYEWSPGATLSCTNCPEPYAFPKVKTLYTVISTDINGCHDTATAEVDIKTHVTSIVGDGGEICQGEVFTLQVTGARTYQWSPSGSLDDYTSASPKASPWEDTRYRVIAYEGSCIPDTSEVDLVVHPKPTVSVRGEQTIVAGTTADLLASGDHIVRFLWSPASTLSCETCSNPVASPFKTTTYTVKVFSKFECVDSANVTITILCDEKQLFVPNTFTPNGDGVNDIFMVRGTGINTLKAFRVYNRWGQVMFERSDVTVNDKAYGWDGTFNGAQLPPDVYVWTVEAYCENGDLLKLKGDVTIIR